MTTRSQPQLSKEQMRLRNMLGKPSQVQSLVCNGKRQELVELFKLDPSAISRAWSAAQHCTVQRRDKIIRQLSSLLCGFHPSYLVKFIKGELLVESTPSVRWPYSFYQQAPVELVLKLLDALKLLDGFNAINLEPSLYLFSLGLVKAANPVWKTLLEKFSATENDNEAGILMRMLGLVLLVGKIPLPTIPGWTIKNIAVHGRMVVQRQPDLSFKCWPLMDPKGTLTFESFEWSLPDRKTLDKAKDVLRVMLDDYVMPLECRGHIRRLDGQAAIAEISALWTDIRLVTSEDPPRKLRSWLPGKGLLELETKLLGCDADQTGIGPISVDPGNSFPNVRVTFSWEAWGLFSLEKDLLNPRTGLLHGLRKLADDADEYRLRLLLNLEIVRCLHHIAFDERKAEKKPTEKAEAEEQEEKGEGEDCQEYTAIFPMIYRLPSWARGASEAATKRSLALIGMRPPPKHSLRASPPIKSRKTHPTLKPIVLELEITES